MSKRSCSPFRCRISCAKHFRRWWPRYSCSNISRPETTFSVWWRFLCSMPSLPPSDRTERCRRRTSFSDLEGTRLTNTFFVHFCNIANIRHCGMGEKCKSKSALYFCVRCRSAQLGCFSAKSRVRGHMRLYLAYVPENDGEEVAEDERPADEVRVNYRRYGAYNPQNRSTDTTSPREVHSTKSEHWCLLAVGARHVPGMLPVLNCLSCDPTSKSFHSTRERKSV